MKQRIKQLGFSHLRWILSGLIFIGMSCAYYGFFYVVREALRLNSINEDYNIFTFSDFEVWFWNFLIALLAVIIGMSTSIEFLVNAPRTKKLNQLQRTSILNDQRFLQWGFLFFALELFVSLGLSFGYVWGKVVHTVLFSKEIAIILLFSAIVIYLKQFHSVVRWIKVKPIVIYFWGILLVCLFAMLLSFINFYDYKNINESVLRKNVPYAYEYVQPVSEILQVSNPYYWREKIYVVHDKNIEEIEPKYIYQHEEVTLKELKAKLKDQLSNLAQYDGAKFAILLHINARTNMEYVNKLKFILAEVGIPKAHYQVVSTKYDLEDAFISEYIPNHLIPQTPEDNQDDFLKYSIHITDDDLSFNQTKVSSSNFKDTVERIIQNESNIVFDISYPSTLTFGKYIVTRSQMMSVFQNVRDEYAQSKYGKLLDFLDRNHQSEVRKRFPILINDLNYDSLIVEKQ